MGMKISRGLVEKTYSQFEKDFGLIPICLQGGAGTESGWTLPSFLIWPIKSRTFFFSQAAEVATGAEYTKA